MTTQEAIKKEFMHLYSHKDFNHITVKELCAGTPVARTTFYSYYENTDELKEDIENDLIRGLDSVALDTSQGNMPKMDFSLFFANTMDYIKEHWEDIHAFLITQPNFRFITKWKSAIKQHLRLRYPERQRDENEELLLEAISCAVIGGYSYWMENPDTVDMNKLNQVIASGLATAEEIL